MITPAYAPTATERVLPRLALDFTTASLDPRVTITRALNTATRFNSSGLIEIVNADLPRFDYDPITKICKGLLIEEARSNLLVNSDQFNLTWSQNNVTVTPNDAVSPDGTTNADKIDEGTSLSVHSVSQAFSSVSGTSYAWSCFVKNIDRRYVQLFYGSAGHGSNAFANFDLQNGTVGTVGSSATASITDVGNGWYRCTVVAAATATTAGASAQLALITSATAARAENYTGTNKVIYAWGAQVEAGAFATSYIPTTTTSLTRNADVVSMTGTNFSSWYQAGSGTLQAIMTRYPVSTGYPRVACLSDNTANNEIAIANFNPNGGVGMNVANGGAVQASTFISLSGNDENMAFRFGANDFAISLNSSTVTTDTAGTVPTVSQMLIGTGPLTSSPICNGWYKKIMFFNNKLINNELRSVSKL